MNDERIKANPTKKKLSKRVHHIPLTQTQLTQPQQQTRNPIKPAPVAISINKAKNNKRANN